MLHIYTDGACSYNKVNGVTKSSGPGGWGLYVEDNNKNELHSIYGSSHETTNNRMEMTGFLHGLMYGLMSNKDKAPIYIYTDSAYITNCFHQKWYVKWRANGWRNSKKEPVKNKSIWIEIFNYYDMLINNGISVNVIKVKGHSGDRGNEAADMLAVKGKMEALTL